MRLIDADALMEQFAKLQMVILLDSVEEAEIASMIGNAPTIDPVKHGRWIEREVIDDRKDAKIPQWQSAKCSVCGKYHTTPYLYYFDHFNYCPDCGALMDEVEEE